MVGRVKVKLRLKIIMGTNAGTKLDVARYSEPKDESSVDGREAYFRYGSVAFRTVYSIGGHLVTAGKVVEVVRESHAGPTRGEWDDISIMQYPSQQAILSMKQVPNIVKR
jgi:hypothetical protein